MTPIVTQANFQGGWTTGLSAQFGNGTYSAFLQQYLPDDFDLDWEVYTDSQTATFTVNLDTLSLGAAAGGTRSRSRPAARVPRATGSSF